MSGPFQYRPPVTPVYYPQEFLHQEEDDYEPYSRPSQSFAPASMRNLSRTPYSSYTPRPSFHSHSGPYQRYAPSLPDVNTPSVHAFPALEPDIPNYERFPWNWSTARSRRDPQPPSSQQQWLHDPPRYPVGAGYRRRHSFSFGASRSPYLPPQLNMVETRPQVLDFNDSPFGPFYINPWINAHDPRRDFFFDLASSEYRPRVYKYGEAVPLPNHDLDQPATHPPRLFIRILIDGLPKWPCDIFPHPTTNQSRRDIDVRDSHSPMPITLREILTRLYRHLHSRLDQSDWTDLGYVGQTAVGMAFNKRCMAFESPRRYQEERSDGVKRIDCLMEKTRMIGLLYVGKEGGWDVMKLVCDYPPHG